MKLLSIVGARPQFIKIAPIARAIEAHNDSGKAPIEHIIVHTGQHYDAGMSDVFFEELELPKATFHLGVGSAAHGRQTGQMLEKIEQVLLESRPDIVVIYGDTNSTVAGALAASKLHQPVAHIEAGLRSFNRRMPEEINRVAADHMSDLLLAPTPTAMENLEREGLTDRTAFTGDVMYDAVLDNRRRAQDSQIISRLALEPHNFGLATLHRAENTDDENRLRNLLSAFNDIAADGLPLVLPLHPRTARKLSTTFTHWTPHPNLRLIEPVGYLDMLCLLGHAQLALTDSGGLQKEAFFLNCPCITLREETEWVETVRGEANTLVGSDQEKIHEAVSNWRRRFSSGAVDFSSQVSKSFGNGNAAGEILTALLSLHQPTVYDSQVTC